MTCFSVSPFLDCALFFPVPSVQVCKSRLYRFRADIRCGSILLPPSLPDYVVRNTWAPQATIEGIQFVNEPSTNDAGPYARAVEEVIQFPARSPRRPASTRPVGTTNCSNPYAEAFRDDINIPLMEEQIPLPARNESNRLVSHSRTTLPPVSLTLRHGALKSCAAPLAFTFQPCRTSLPRNLLRRTGPGQPHSHSQNSPETRSGLGIQRRCWKSGNSRRSAAPGKCN